MIIAFASGFHPVESLTEQEKQTRSKGHRHNYNARSDTEKSESRGTAIASSSYNNMAWHGYEQLKNTSSEQPSGQALSQFLRGSIVVETIK